MGRLAEALRANLKSVAASDARALREIDQELRSATSGVVPCEVQLTGQVDAKALLGKGSFKQQTVTTLRRICRENGIKGFSKLKKAELCQTLEVQGIQAPPPPLESFSKKELVTLLKTLLKLE
jgi:hypothetical protein